MELTTNLKNEYLARWHGAYVLTKWQDETARACDVIIAHKDRYKIVETATGVPWHVVACIHGMESNFDFSTHLHNGDSLQDYTYHVPAGRPHVGHPPPFRWTESAVDALKIEGFENIIEWDVANTLFSLEKYNGWGYRAHPGHVSQYLWSGTSEATSGKFVSDGVWRSNAASDQIGCVAMWKELEKRGALETTLGSDATWIDVQKDVATTVMTAYAVSVPLEQIRTNKKEEIVSFLLRHTSAGNVLVAPFDKKIPKL